MKVGVIGLGRMGFAIAERCVKADHTVVGFDLNKDFIDAASRIGIIPVSSSAELAQQVDVVWLMVPVGKPVDTTLEEIISHITQDTIVVDGGNSKYTDTIRRASLFAQHQRVLLDCGTSGGLRGRQIGFSLMVGGKREAYETIIPLLKAIACDNGYGYMGPSGAGHFVKMIHNGIEYGIMQAYAEGFHLLKEGEYEKLDLADIARVWSHGSVIRSWLLDLLHDVLCEDQNLTDVSGVVAEGGTGRWTVEHAHEKHVPLEVIERALDVRSKSRENGGNYATKLVALLRNKFGGHAVVRVGDE